MIRTYVPMVCSYIGRIGRWTCLAVLISLAVVAHPVRAASADCTILLDEFLAYSSKEAAPYTSKDQLVYFLHIPRTAGRTFFTCLLNQGTKSRCNKKYDQRIDQELEDCHMLSSHDDFSVLQQLPPNTAVVSQFRDPVGRVLSAYEFAVEGASLHLNRAAVLAGARNATLARPPVNMTMNSTHLEALRRAHAAKNKTAARTDDVWPWSHLIPFFAEDIQPKTSALKSVPVQAPGVWSEQRADDGTRYYWNEYTNTSKWELTEEEREHLAPNLHSYDNGLVMPLLEFLHSPIATELVHNGQVLQVLGLTNYSTWDKAADMHACMLRHKDIAENLLELALKRIERFTHVGTTAQLNNSVEAAAALLRTPLSGPAYLALPMNVTVANHSQASKAASEASVPENAGVLNGLKRNWQQLTQMLSPLKTEATGKASGALAVPQAEVAEGAIQESRRKLLKFVDKNNKTRTRVIGTLGEEYHNCVKSARDLNNRHKHNALVHLKLNDRRQVYFDKEDRKTIPEDIIEEIRRLNALDMRLYERAQELLEQRRNELSAAGTLEPLPELPKEGCTKCQGNTTSPAPDTTTEEEEDGDDVEGDEEEGHREGEEGGDGDDGEVYNFYEQNRPHGLS